MSEEGFRIDGHAERWFNEIITMLNAESGNERRYTLRMEYRPDGGAESAVVSEWRHGVSSDFVYPAEFFDGADYKAIRSLSEQLHGLIGESAYVQRGEKTQSVGSFRQGLEWLLEDAKRGQHIQRYKGLGEMNPEQLWETTMDPNSRRMLQVQIEDAIAADEIFTTLMGDQVEPRRDFIEQNALYVSNLDV
jgi:DNA gyrase subunit B